MGRRGRSNTEEAVNFCHNQFSGDQSNSDFSMVQHIPLIITGEDNLLLNSLPIAEEIKKVMFTLNVNSTWVPDDFTSHFYQSCWDIVGQDIIRLVHSFFKGRTLSKAITHTNLILLPKKDGI